MYNQLEATRWSRRQRGQTAETVAPPGFQPPITTSNRTNTPTPPLPNQNATPAAPTLATPANQYPIPPFSMPAMPITENPYHGNANLAFPQNSTHSVPNRHATPAQHPNTQSYFTHPLQPSAPMFDQNLQHPSMSSSDVTSV